MNSQTVILTDIQSAEAKCRDLVIRIKAAVEGKNEDREGLLKMLLTIQKEMSRSLQRSHRQAPPRTHREKYDVFLNSFELTRKVLNQALQSLLETRDHAHYTPPAMPTEVDIKIWQEVYDDLADTAIDAERNRTKQKRESINRVLDFLDALDRLLDDNTADEPFLERLLEMFRPVRTKALSNLASVGLEKIASPVGNPLDPTRCEVVDTESDDGSEPLVRKQLRAGYTLDSKGFRKAAVIVGSAE